MKSYVSLLGFLSAAALVASLSGCSSEKASESPDSSQIAAENVEPPSLPRPAAAGA